MKICEEVTYVYRPTGIASGPRCALRSLQSLGWKVGVTPLGTMSNSALTSRGIPIADIQAWGSFLDRPTLS
jgi:hypothetical protein